MEVIAENINDNYDKIVSLLKNTKDQIEIEVEIDKEYVVSYSPGLPVFTYGDSIETAKSNALEALYFTFEEYSDNIEDRFEIKFIK